MRPTQCLRPAASAITRAWPTQLPWEPNLDYSKVCDESAAGEKARRRIGAYLKKEFYAEWEITGTSMGYTYAGSPIVIPDGTSPVPDDPVVYVQSARPGSRAPHAWLSESRSTLDLFGEGFVLLRFGKSADVRPLTDAARARNVPLKVVDIAQPEIAELYERRLVLVRPDGHTAWRGDDVPRDPLGLIDTVRGETLFEGVSRSGASTPATA